MSSISSRFALASTLVALFILALTGGVNYLFLKKELLINATKEAQLIENNSRYHIESLISKTKETSSRLKNIFQNSGFTKEKIEKNLTEVLLQEKSFFAMAFAFNPQDATHVPFSPYYYKNKNKILYKNLASKDYNYLTKEWFRIPIQTNKFFWSEPYFDTMGGNRLMVTYSNPIIQKKKTIAILTIDISLKKLQELISSISVLDSGYAFILSKKHQILVHPQSDKIMQIYQPRSFQYNKMIEGKKHWVYYTHIGNTDLTLGIVFPINELFSSLHYISIISLILATIGTLLLIFTMFFVSHKISRPLRELTLITQEVSKGNFDKKIEFPKNHDEVFQLSLAINTMQKAIKRHIEDLKIATVKEQKIDSELEIARSIQMSMLPKNISPNKILSIYSTLQPAKAVGGDFYDFFYINDEYLCFVVADVSGKGIPAAMFMSETMSYLRAFSSIELSACELISKLNNALASNNEANMFVTLFLGLLNLKTGELNYVNAGHTEPYMQINKQEYEKIPSIGNPIIGAFENLAFKDETIFLKKNSKLFLYTDGVTEAFRSNNEQFGEKRVLDILNASKYADRTIQSVEESIKSFTKDYEQSDDITMLLLEFHSNQVNLYPLT